VRQAMDAPDPALVRNMKKFTSVEEARSSRSSTASLRAQVNLFLSSIIEGLSAKVFRTYHATKTVEESLGSKDVSEGRRL